MPLEDVQVRILQAAANQYWLAAPWRWTVGVFDPTPLTATGNDFAIAGTPVDASVLYLLRAYIDDGQSQKPLVPEAILPAGVTVKGSPNKVAYISGATPKLRITPVQAALPTGVTPYIFAWYKKSAPIITKSTMATAGLLTFPDEYAWVFEAGVLYYAYLYADDTRAGGVQMQMAKDGSSAPGYSGQLAVFMDAMARLREVEPMVSIYEGDLANVTRRVG
jgi:hypothetical protein